jgi:signal peptidase I
MCSCPWLRAGSIRGIVVGAPLSSSVEAGMVRLALLISFVCCGCSNMSFRQTSEIMTPTINVGEVVTAQVPFFRQVLPRRWEVVIFLPPSTNTYTEAKFWSMRVVGLPGERIKVAEDGVYIDKKRQDQPVHLSHIRFAPTIAALSTKTVSYPYEVPLNCYFLLGDNTTNSFDSRFWGALHGSRIIGRIKGK